MPETNVANELHTQIQYRLIEVRVFPNPLCRAFLIHSLLRNHWAKEPEWGCRLASRLSLKTMVANWSASPSLKQEQSSLFKFLAANKCCIR